MSWKGGMCQELAEKCSASFHSLPSLSPSLDGRQAVFMASVSDLTGYMTLGKLKFGNNVGQYGKNQNITPVEQHCRLCKHVLLTQLV